MGLQQKHWVVHVLRRAQVPGAEDLALAPGMATLQAWIAACEATGLAQDGLTRHVADYFRLKVAALDHGEPTALRLVPEKVARQYQVYPLKENDRHLVVATSDPTNFSAEQAIGFISGRKAIFEVASPGSIRIALDRGYGPDRTAEASVAHAADGTASPVAGVDETGSDTVEQRRAPPAPDTELADMGIPPWELGRLRQLLSQRDGLLCVASPPGSGKTTTMYGVIQEIATRDVNIVTVEDPIAYELPGITQVQVPTARQVTHADALRAVLRDAPDVIFVGELRDRETAEVAVQAAMTGHLILTTVEADEAVRVVARLLEIGLDRSSIAATLRGAVAQRLVRRVCDECGEPIRGEMTGEEVRLARLYNLRPPIRSVGCRRCAETGFRGRLAIQEVLVMNNTLAGMVTNGATHTELFAAALSAGMRPLLHVGLERVRSGATTLEELDRVLGIGDDAAPQSEPPAGEHPDPATAPSAAPDASAASAASAAPDAPDASAPDVEPAPDVTTPATEDSIPTGWPESAAAGPTELVEVAAGGVDDVVRGARPEDGPILIVDDDPEDRLLVRTILRKHGWRVEEAVDGDEALNRIASGTDYALVVLDLVMPNIDGRDVLSRIRTAGSTVPVIVMTGSSDPEDEPLLIEGGADDYLRKPLDPRRFVARVRAALRRARMA